MQLEELHTILLTERESGRLLSLPPDLFEKARREIERLTTEVYAQQDPFSEETRLLIEEVGSLREIVAELFRARTAKILALATSQEDGLYIDRDELKRMLPPERTMFDQITLGIAECRCFLTGSGTGPIPGQMEAAEGAAPPGEAGPLSPPYVLVRALETMEPFMGVDGRIYALEKEDIVTLPERNAAVLCDRKIVLSVESPGDLPHT